MSRYISKCDDSIQSQLLKAKNEFPIQIVLYVYTHDLSRRFLGTHTVPKEDDNSFRVKKNTYKNCNKKKKNQE